MNISYELSTKLKNLGYNNYTSASYVGDELVKYIGWKNSWKLNDPVHKFPEGGKNARKMTSAPNIQEVIEWLMGEHIYITYDLVFIGSDEWEYGYIINYLPKEFHGEKRRSSHFKTIESWSIGYGSYTGAWRDLNEAYLEAIEYSINNLLK